MEQEEFTPRILAFCCNWCSYTGADLAGTSRIQMPATVRNIRIMCSSRVDPLFIVKAYLRGADGILIAGCHPGDCHYNRGNYYARRRIALMKKVLEEVGLETDRVMLSWISASEGQKYADVTSDFTEKIKEMGPNPVRKEVFL